MTAKNMKTKLRPLDNDTRTFAMTEPGSRRKPLLPLLMRLLGAAALTLPALSCQAGAVLTTLYSFTGGNGGANPYAALLQGSDAQYHRLSHERPEAVLPGRARAVRILRIKLLVLVA